MKKLALALLLVALAFGCSAKADAEVTVDGKARDEFDTIYFGDGTSQTSAGAVATGETTNYVSKFSAADTIGNSVMYDDGTNVGIGTTAPSATIDIAVSQSGVSVNIPNDAWISADNDLDAGTINMFQVNSSDAINVGAGLNVSGFTIVEDAGLVTLINMPVSSTSADGTEEAYVFSMDNSEVMRISALADGSGGVDTLMVGISGDLTVVGSDSTSLNIGSDLTTDGTDLFFLGKKCS